MKCDHFLLPLLRIPPVTLQRRSAVSLAVRAQMRAPTPLIHLRPRLTTRPTTQHRGGGYGARVAELERHNEFFSFSCILKRFRLGYLLELRGDTE
jgi:hypothetical protein